MHMIAACIPEDLRLADLAPEYGGAEFIANFTVESILTRCAIAMPLLSTLETLSLAAVGTGHLPHIHICCSHFGLTPWPQTKPCVEIDCVPSKLVKFLHEFFLTQFLEELLNLAFGDFGCLTSLERALHIFKLICYHIALEMVKDALGAKLVLASVKHVSCIGAYLDPGLNLVLVADGAINELISARIVQ